MNAPFWIKYIWQGIKTNSNIMIPIPAFILVDFGINNKASNTSTTPDRILISFDHCDK